MRCKCCNSTIAERDHGIDERTGKLEDMCGSCLYSIKDIIYKGIDILEVDRSNLYACEESLIEYLIDKCKQPIQD